MASKLHPPTKVPSPSSSSSSSSSSSPNNNVTNNESRTNIPAIIINNNNNNGGTNNNNDRGSGKQVAVVTPLSLSPYQIEKRRDHTKKQNIRRAVYRELTSFAMFPLQAMAMDDYNERAKDYFHVGGNDVVGDDGVVVGTTTAEGAIDGSGSVARGSDDGDDGDDDDDDEVILRHQYRREFLREKSISMPAASALKDGSVDVEWQDSNGGQEVDNPVRQEKDENSTAADTAIDGGETSHLDGREIPVIKSQESCSQSSITNSIEPNSQAQSIDSAKLQQQQQQPQQQNTTNKRTMTSPSSSHVPHQSSSQFKLPTLWSMEPRIFASETTMKGKRRYISAHLGRFLDHYWRECDAYNRHYYELIKEGTPCRLYFDLEFNKRANPLLTPTITETLLDQLFAQLQIQYRTVYDISIRRSDMVDLDSSTRKKFSRHWILHLPNGALFSDAREAGVFVRGMVSRLEEERVSGRLRRRGHDLLADNLFVNAEEEESNEEEEEDDGNENETCEEKKKKKKKKKKKLTRFIDLGVYTRNRIFRLLGSTKFGKPVDAALRIAEANEFPFPKGFDNSKFYLPEMNDRGAMVGNDDSDVAHRDADADGNNDDFESFCKSLSWEDHADAMAVTLIVPANASKTSYPILTNPSDLLSDDEKQRITALRHLDGSGTGGAPSRFPRSTPSYGPSPLPKLEHFIANTLARREGLVGSIGTWSLGGNSSSSSISSTSHHHAPLLPQTASFNMKGNRYCENIQRAHKSNQIIWNVHLVDRTCWQGCHDPECRGFRGRSIDLPEEVNAEIDEYFMDVELSSLNERDIIGNKENVGAVATVPPPPSSREEEDGEFDDPALEAAMCQLDISGVAREKAEAAFDVELGELDLSGIIVSHNRGKSGPLSEKNNRIDVVASNHKKVPVERKTNRATIAMRLLEPWEDDENLDLELAKLNLSDIVSS